MVLASMYLRELSLKQDPEKCLKIKEMLLVEEHTAVNHNELLTSLTEQSICTWKAYCIAYINWE